MDLHLEDQVIILDEGHNVEDSAREYASYSLTVIQLEEVVNEMEKMCMCVFLYMCVCLCVYVCMHVCMCV